MVGPDPRKNDKPLESDEAAQFAEIERTATQPLGVDTETAQDVAEGYGDPVYGPDGMPLPKDQPMGGTPGDDQRREAEGQQ